MSIKIINPMSSEDLFNGQHGIFFSKGDVHIWETSLDASKELTEKCFNSLSQPEKERSAFFKFEKVQNNYVISQGILHLLLGMYLNIDADKVKLGRHAKGKPFSADNLNLRFNMSNSGRKVVYAFSMEEELGIDLEFSRDLDDLNDLITKNFTSSEIDYITKNPSEKKYRFFKFWTIKEAYLKAIGEGMRLPPDKLEFSINNGKFKLQSINGVDEQDDWDFKDFNLGDNYIGTLVLKNTSANIIQHSII